MHTTGAGSWFELDNIFLFKRVASGRKKKVLGSSWEVIKHTQQCPETFHRLLNEIKKKRQQEEEETLFIIKWNFKTKREKGKNVFFF
jgi:hypothetical protein